MTAATGRTPRASRTRLQSVARLFCLVALLLSKLAVYAAPASKFDHFTTSFELAGAHRDVPCEACHVGGIFKGTPHDCVSCHMTGSRIGATAKPTTHILSSNDCAACHTPAGWKPVAMFNHLSMIGTCSSCHNNVQTIGKPANHIPTSLDCGSCHLPTLPWTRANFTHAGIVGNCMSCHNGVQAPGKPAAHLPTREACETCHSRTSFTTWAGTSMVHAGITSGCQSCHETGMSWTGVTMVDRPTAAQDPAHPSAEQAPDCASCHQGFNTGDFSRIGLPAGHLPTTAACGQCHTTPGQYALYVMGATGHQGITGGCATCHASGKSFLGIASPALVEPPVGPPAHLPIPAADGCETCHSPSNFAIGGFGPATPMNHAGISSGCQTCHETGMAWKGVTMVDRPTVAQDASHPTVAQGADCAVCHQGFNVGDFNKNAKPLGHIPTGAACAQCHTSLPDFSRYTAGTTLHTGITSGCATCHAGGTGPWAGVGGLTFVIKQPPANHLPVNGKACESCHSTTRVATNGFGPSTPMNHAGITSGCQTCHETGMSWTGVTMVDRPTTAQDPNHPTAAQGADCASCHSTSNFAVGAFNIPTVLPAGHLPTSLSCTTCHTAIPTWSTYVMGTTGHAGITSGCATCHASGKSFLGIASPALVEPPVGPPAHLPIPAADGCETCHSPSNFAIGGFGPATPMNHAGISSGCQTCHETGMAWKGVTMVDRPTPSQDPNHPTAAADPDCSKCHQGFNVGDFNKAAVKPAGHIPTTAACSQCHATPGNYGLYTGGATLHTGLTSGCATCHASGTGPWAGVGGLTFVIKQPPANHIPIGTAACEGCHSTTNFTSFAGTTMKHAPVAAETCQSCHEYTMRTANYWYGIALIWHRDSQNHHGTQDCAGSQCHSARDGKSTCTNNCGNAVLLGSVPLASIKAIKPGSSAATEGHPVGAGAAPSAAVVPVSGARFDHSAAAGQACVSCHGTSARGRRASHPTTTANCGACHVTIVWMPVTRIDHAEARGACRTCHDGTHAAGKPASHLQTVADCDSCHTSSAWRPAVFDHATVLGGSCMTCHNGSTVAGKPVGHPSTLASCDSCHYTLAWRPTRPAARKLPSVVPVHPPRAAAPAARAP